MEYVYNPLEERGLSVSDSGLCMMVSFGGSDIGRVAVNSLLALLILGHAVVQLVEALRYKSEGRGFDSRWCHWNFSLTILPAALWLWC